MTRLVKIDKDNNPGGARWCDEHRRLECTKQRPKWKLPCHQAAIRGTNACLNHGGHSIKVAKAKGEARITAWDPNGPANINSSAAVLSVLQMTYLRLSAYSEMLRRQVELDGGNATDLKGSGLIGNRYGMGGKDGIVYVQSEEVRALVLLEAAERDKVVKYAKTAHDMGISDRLTSMAERWGDVVATRITAVLDALGLTVEQARLVPDLLRQHLGSIDMDAIESGPSQ